jgi:hypothetical protein
VYSKISTLVFIVSSPMGKKKIPGLGWHGMAAYIPRVVLWICVGNGAKREWPSLHDREDRNRLAIHDLAALNDRLYTKYN